MEPFSLFIPESIADALGWTVVHSLWQGALLAILLSGFRWLALRFSPQVRYAAGVFALVVLLVASVWTFFAQWEVSPKGEEVVLFFSGTVDPSTPTYLQGWTAALEARFPLLVAAWLLGMLFFLFRTLGGLWYISRLRQSTQALSDPEWQGRMWHLAQQMGIRKPVALVESVRVSVPMVVGHLKPLLLLPVGLVNQLNIKEVEAILAHELAHIRRHDYLVNLIQSLMEVFYYFNPAVWYISSAIRTERENCCDDWAVTVCGNSVTYVRALVQIQEHAGSIPQFALSAAGSQKPLLNRVRRILNQPNHKKSIMERFTATLLLLAGIMIFSISASQPDEIPPAPDGPKAVLTSLQTSPDSIPPAPKTVEQIVKEEGDRLLELTLENGEVSEFKVNGEIIPPSEYGKYQKELDELKGNLSMPVPPPPPPGLLPPPPPPPAPNAPPPPPPAPGMEKEVKVVAKVKEDGQVIVWIDEEEGEAREIVVEKEEMIFKGENGEKKVIIIQDGNVEWEDKDGPVIVKPHPGHRELEYRYEIQEREREHAERDLERMERELERQHRELEEQSHRMEREIEIIVEDREMQFRQQEDIARERELHKAPRSPRHREGGLKSAIERELQRDGYIRSDGSYTFELSGKKLLINGKKESEVIFNKYKRIYESQTGLTLSKDSRIEIED